MNKKLIGVAIVLAAIIGLSAAGAATAQPTMGSLVSPNGKMKVTWAIQISGPNHVTIIKKTWTRTNHNPWHLASTNIKTLNKVNRHTLEITATNPPFAKLVTTRLTAVQYLALHFRQLLADP